MEVPTVQELDSLKYSELQRLAKTVGLKANLKADKLLKSLKQHFLHEPKGENLEQDSESSQSSIMLTDEDDLNSSQEKEHITVAHVTKRRGKGRKVVKSNRCPKVDLNVNKAITNEIQPSVEQQKAFCDDKENKQSKDVTSVKATRKRSHPDDEAATENQTNDTLTPGGKIPRFVGSHLKLGSSGTKPTTPNFKKLHEAHFKKMESIDTFVERNKKRLEAFSNPNQVVKATHAGRKENQGTEIKNSGEPEMAKCTDNFKARQGTAEDTVTKPDKEKLTDGNLVEVPSGKNIPRYARHLSRPDSELKATTPNLKKLKVSHFEKMSLLDEYLGRKKERLNAIANSIQEVKMLAEKKILKQVGRKLSVSNLKKNGNGVALFSPVLSRNRHSICGTPASQRRSPRTSVSLANLSLLTEKASFKPSILSSSKMNVRFSETTKDNEHKQSLIKTPARRSPYVHIETDTPNNQQMKGSHTRKSFGKPLNLEPVLESRKTGDFTPFKFMGEKVETPGTNKKSSFDIKASLARPLGYEPYKGKLKPWGDSNENARSVTKSMNRGLSSLKKDYKQPRLQTRETRRDEHVKGRKAKKDDVIGTRRGIIMT